MSEMQHERPGEPGTPEGETGATESDPVAPSVEGRTEATTGGYLGGHLSLVRMIGTADPRFDSR